MKTAISIIVILLVLRGCIKQDENVWLSNAPAGNKYTKIFKPDSAVLPNGRIITPAGKQIQTAPHPYGLTMSRDGSVVITANSGVRPFSISIIENYITETPLVRQIPPGYETDDGILAAVYMGIAISPDNRTVFVAGGQEGIIYMFNIQTGDSTGKINCLERPGSTPVKHGYIGDLVLSADGKTLYALDQIQFKLLVIDTETKKVIKTASTGRYPFGIALSPDEQKVYAANVGVFEYKPFGDIDPENLKETAKDYPPFGYNTKEMKEGINTDSIKVPGLGDPNSTEAFSIWCYDVSGETIKTTAKIKTGFLVGQEIEGIPAVGGASPNSIAATDEYVFVSNGNNDCITVIDAVTEKIIKNIMLAPDERISSFRGVIPFGVALSPDNNRLYVAESGINAIGVIDINKMEIIGHIPSAWFPSKLKITPDGKKIVAANAKGFGSGPNAGPDFDMGPEGSYVGNLMKGYVSVIDVPSDEDLKEMTEKVISNNFKFSKTDDSQFAARKDNPIPLYPGEKETPIKHIIFISKENRTYDEVFGQVKDGKGLPELARFGLGRNITNRSGDKLDNIDVMPNHLKLAEEFSISDNFYCDSDHSADGHRWLVATYPNEWVEVNVSNSYGGGRSMRADSDAPGNFVFVGSTGAIYPEDYNEAGSIWEHMDRNNIDFFNFGFGLELAPSLSDMAFKYTGVKYVINYPVPEPLFDKSSKKYATYNMSIPDQFRADMFIEEFNEKWVGEGKTLPQVLTIILPNDHGSGERPEAGYPYFESYMMDNDLALGRLIQFLSHTEYWKNMAIIITEDDPQGGVDHVDAHRSILMVISPYAKKNYVGHVHYSFGSIFKTFWHILGTAYLNQYDAGASDMEDMFTDKPDFSPYNAVTVDKRVFNPDSALNPFDARFDWDAFMESPKLDDPEVMKKQNKEYEEKQKMDK